MTTLSIDVRQHYSPRTPMLDIVRDQARHGRALSNDPRRWFIARRVRPTTPDLPPRAA